MKPNLFIACFLVAAFMVNLTGCRHDEHEGKTVTEETPDTNNEIERELTIKFGTEDPWTAQTIIGNMNDDVLYLLAYPSYSSTGFPCLSMQIKPTIGTYAINGEDFNPMLNPNARQYIEYYHDQVIQIDGVPYGDWWVKSGTITITAFDKAHLTITGTLNLILFNAKERYMDLSDHYNEVSVSIVMNQIAITPPTKQ